MPSGADCDLTFDLLTRGPFPSGGPSDRTVEDHVQVCHECRMLAEALRPALDLFHVSLDSDARVGRPPDDKPSRFQRQIMDAVRRSDLDRSVDASEGVRQLASSPVVRYRQFVQLALVPALLFLCAALFLRSNGGISGIASAKGAELKRVTGIELLEMLAVPESCRSLAVSGATGLAGYACCTECHSARESTGTVEPTAIPCMNRLAVSCNACHMPDQTKHGCCGDCHADSRAADVEILAYCREQVNATCETCHNQVPG